MNELEEIAAAQGVPPLLPEHAAAPRHQVRDHSRTLPPLPIPEDHGQMNADEILGIPSPERTPREVPVKSHSRKNPRRKEPEMSSIAPPAPDTADHRQTALARAGDPYESHKAAASVTDLTSSQVAVLAQFRQWEADRLLTQDTAPHWMTPGFTDEALVDLMERHQTPYSPSRIRTARLELTRGGLLADQGDCRPTKRGRDARVFDLTDLGRNLNLEG